MSVRAPWVDSCNFDFGARTMTLAYWRSLRGVPAVHRYCCTPSSPRGAKTYTISAPQAPKPSPQRNARTGHSSTHSKRSAVAAAGIVRPPRCAGSRRSTSWRIVRRAARLYHRCIISTSRPRAHGIARARVRCWAVRRIGLARTQQIRQHPADTATRTRFAFAGAHPRALGAVCLARQKGGGRRRHTARRSATHASPRSRRSRGFRNGRLRHLASPGANVAASQGFGAERDAYYVGGRLDVGICCAFPRKRPELAAHGPNHGNDQPILAFVCPADLRAFGRHDASRRAVVEMNSVRVARVIRPALLFVRAEVIPDTCVPDAT